MCSERHDRVAQRNAARRRDADDNEKETVVLDVNYEGDATSIFCTWGALIKTHFDLANLHLTARTVDTSSAQLVAAVTGVGRIVGGLHAQVASLQREVARLRGQAAAGQSAVCPSPLATPAEPAPPGKPQGAAPSPHRDSAASPAAAVGAAAVTAVSCRRSRLRRRCLCHTRPASAAQAERLHRPAAAECERDACVQHLGKEGGGLLSRDAGQGRRHMPSMFEGKQQKPKAELCVRWFDAIALPDENPHSGRQSAPQERRARPSPMRVRAGSWRSVCTASA